MNAPRLAEALRPEVSVRSVALICILTAVIAVSEASLFFGHVRYTIWAYFVLLFALSLAPLLFEGETPIFQAFVLIPVFRLVNLAMPVFVDLTLLWLPLIYAPLLPVFVYFGWQTFTSNAEHSRTGPSSETAASQGTGDPSPREIERAGHGLPWWLGGDQGGKLRWLLRRSRTFLAPPDEELSLLRSIMYWIARGLFVVLFPLVFIAFLVSMFVLAVYLAEIEYGIITPAPLIPSHDFYQLAVLTVIMIGFVGFVEELLFRGILQKVLERQVGLVPGLLLASGIFGLMHSAYGVPMGIAFAGGIGLLFGIVYDVTESLVLVSVMHGLMNVLVFGVIPLTGASPVDLLRIIVVRELRRIGAGWIIDILALIEPWMFVGIF